MFAKVRVTPSHITQPKSQIMRASHYLAGSKPAGAASFWMTRATLIPQMRSLPPGRTRDSRSDRGRRAVDREADRAQVCSDGPAVVRDGSLVPGEQRKHLVVALPTRGAFIESSRPSRPAAACAGVQDVVKA